MIFGQTNVLAFRLIQNVTLEKFQNAPVCRVKCANVCGARSCKLNQYKPRKHNL